MFGHASLPSQRYTYHAYPPITEEARVREQLHLAHRYRNALVALERWRRERYAAIIGDAPELTARVTALVATIDALRATIRTQNAEVRGRTGTPEQRTLLKSLTAEARECRAKRRAAAEARRDDAAIHAGLEALAQEVAVRQRGLRAESGLFWGTYLSVEQGMHAAKSGPPPRFQPWRGEGHLAVQLQGGLTPDVLAGGQDMRLRLCQDARQNPHTGDRRSARHQILSMRVGSKGRHPIFAEIPVRWHRPLPNDVKIKWAELHCHRVGTHETWSVSLVVSRATGFLPDDAAQAGMVAVDVGWRLLPEGLRVAYWVGDDGTEGSLVLPADDLQRWSKVESLQSIRDEAFDAIRTKLTLSREAKIMPEWLQQRVSGMGRWRRQSRLAAVVLAWREQRFAGDAEIFAALETWRQQDKHLYDWGAFQARRATAWRDEQYRLCAARLRRQYHTVLLEDTDWRHLKRRPVPEAASSDAAMRAHQHIGSPGRLQAILREGMAEAREVQAAYTTQRCHVCQTLMHTDAQALYLQCPSCLARHDQDQNACRNMLAWARERSGADVNAGGPRAS